MAEYALLDTAGEVVDIVSTVDIERAKQAFTTYELRPVEDVPLAALERYRYWAERP